MSNDDKFVGVGSATSRRRLRIDLYKALAESHSRRSGVSKDMPQTHTLGPDTAYQFELPDYVDGFHDALLLASVVCARLLDSSKALGHYGPVLLGPSNMLFLAAQVASIHAGLLGGQVEVSDDTHEGVDWVTVAEGPSEVSAAEFIEEGALNPPKAPVTVH